MSSGLIASNPIAGLWAMITSIRTPCWPSRLGCDLKSRELTIIHHPPAPAVVWNANSPDLVLGPSPASRHWQKVWRSRDSLTIYCAPSSKGSSKSSRLRTFSGEIVKMRADYINPVNPRITPIVVNKYSPIMTISPQCQICQCSVVKF